MDALKMGRMLLALAGLPVEDGPALRILESAPRTAQEAEALTREAPVAGVSFCVDCLLLAEARAKARGQAEILGRLAAYYLEPEGRR
jgi:hypothetical protein